MTLLLRPTKLFSLAPSKVQVPNADPELARALGVLSEGGLEIALGVTLPSVASLDVGLTVAESRDCLAERRRSKWNMASRCLCRL